MGLPPGTIRRIPRSRIQDVGWGTHALPLYHVIDFLADAVAGPILVIGIQPADTRCDAPMTPAVRAAAERLVPLLAAGDLDVIESL